MRTVWWFFVGPDVSPGFFFILDPTKNLFIMKQYDLVAITQLLEKSDKWMGHYYEQFPNLNAVYHYVPKHPIGRWCKVVIPLLPGHARRPDLSRPWIGKIMTQDYGLVTISYKPEGSQAKFEVFAHWLHLLVTDPERLMAISHIA